MDANTELLLQAAKNGDDVELARLIPIADPSYNNSRALFEAACGGHVKCIELLLPVSNVQCRDHSALQVAATKGFPECVALFIPLSGLMPLRNALRAAAQNGHVSCVKLLVSQTKNRNNFALQLAACNDHIECVDVLLDHSNGTQALLELQDIYSVDHHSCVLLEQRIVRQKLLSETHACANTRVAQSVRKI